jgi:ABC-2 type transport system permease protein
MSAAVHSPVDATVAWLTTRQLFARRRLWAALAFALVPLLFTLGYRLTNADADTKALEFLVTLYRDIVLGTLLQLAAVLLGTTAFGGEVDDGTIVYLLVKPLPRWSVVLSKYVVALVAIVAVILPGIVLPWLVLGVGSVPARIPVAYGVAAVAGAAIYAALFVALGLRSRRALVHGLLYVVVVEFVMSRSIAGLRSLSIREFALTIAARVADGVAQVSAGAHVSMATVWTMGTVFLVGSLVAAVRMYQRFELAERL